MNQKLMRWLIKISKTPEGNILPKYLLVARCILMPLQSLRWFLTDDEGYQIHKNTWKIHGCEFSDDFFYELTKGNSRWFRTTKNEYGRMVIESREFKDG